MKLLKHKKGFSIGGLIVAIIGIIIAVNVIPSAITAISDASGNYSGTEKAILSLVSLVLVVAVLFGALSAAGIKVKG